MKKNYLILLFFCVIAIGMSAQNNHWEKSFKTKSSLQTKVKDVSQSYSVRSLHPFETQLPDSAIVFSREGDIINKKLYLYGVDNSIIEESLNGRQIYQYDVEGRIIMEEYLWWDDQKGEWIGSNKHVYTYYQGDKYLTDEYYSFDSEVSTYELLERTEYNYDTNGQLVSYNIYYDSDSDGVLELDEIAKCEYTIDIDGYLNYLVYTKLAGESDDQYEPSLKLKIKYNENGYIIYRESAEWYNNQWQDEDAGLTIKIYNDDKLVSEKWYAWDSDLQAWKYIDGTAYTYNSDGNLILMEDFQGDENVAYNTTQYYYPSTLGIGQDKFADNSVLFVDGSLIVDTANTEVISVYSITGALVYSFTKTEGEFTVDLNLPKGIILVKGGTGWVRKMIVK